MEVQVRLSMSFWKNKAKLWVDLGMKMDVECEGPPVIRRGPSLRRSILSVQIRSMLAPDAAQRLASGRDRSPGEYESSPIVGFVCAAV